MAGTFDVVYEQTKRNKIACVPKLKQGMDEGLLFLLHLLKNAAEQAGYEVCMSRGQESRDELARYLQYKTEAYRPLVYGFPDRSVTVLDESGNIIFKPALHDREGPPTKVPRKVIKQARYVVSAEGPVPVFGFPAQISVHIVI